MSIHKIHIPSGSPRARRGSAPVSRRIEMRQVLVLVDVGFTPANPHILIFQPNPPDWTRPPHTTPDHIRTLGEAMSMNSLKVTVAAVSLSMFCSKARISDFFTWRVVCGQAGRACRGHTIRLMARGTQALTSIHPLIRSLHPTTTPTNHTYCVLPTDLEAERAEGGLELAHVDAALPVRVEEVERLPDLLQLLLVQRLLVFMEARAVGCRLSQPASQSGTTSPSLSSATTTHPAALGPALAAQAAALRGARHRRALAESVAAGRAAGHLLLSVSCVLW